MAAVMLLTLTIVVVVIVLLLVLVIGTLVDWVLHSQVWAALQERRRPTSEFHDMFTEKPLQRSDSANDRRAA